MRTMFWAALAVVFLDQSSKILVVHLLDLKSVGSIEVVPPFLNFRMAWNQGINFGLFSNHSDFTRWILIAIAAVIATWVAIWVRKERPGRAGQISAG
ncbi:MAG: signal peptidase II, partial [Paracoccaceae bacterium]